MTRIKKEKIIRYQRYVPKHDFLKNWRVIRLWAMRKYKISEVNLEILLALYSEGLFTQGQFDKVVMTNNWNKRRLDSLIEQGHIHIFRKRQKNAAAKYELTRSARKMCSSIYKKLTGEEKISESSVNNPIFKASNSSYANRQLQKAIKIVNDGIST
jgi:hypothetical protein